ncbi:MAG: hypothetical protein ACOY16_01385 [Chloroflexota bacterium]
MRINADTILELARETVTQRARKDATILSAYLCGAALETDFLLGGAMDIDLVFIHIDTHDPPREIVRVTDEVHFDIAHHPQKEYEPPRRLRAHPWLGPTVFDCKPLFDQRHTLDFIQASVRGLFTRPDTVLERARSQAEHARQMWFGLMDVGDKAGLSEVKLYLKAVEHAANAIALLSGAPLTERRFLLRFPQRAAQVGKPGLFAGLLGLLGGAEVDEQTLQQWLPAWESAFRGLPPSAARLRLHPDRFTYYLRGFEAALNSTEPRAMLWPFLSTWTKIAETAADRAEVQESWGVVSDRLHLRGEAFRERISALDAFLDMTEETLEEWAAANGG